MMVAVIMEDQGVPFTADSILHEIPALSKECRGKTLRG